MKLIKMLSYLHKGDLRIVDQHDAYWPLECNEEDGSAVLKELIEVLSIAEPPVPETE
jgi:hypothetical protein